MEDFLKAAITKRIEELKRATASLKNSSYISGNVGTGAVLVIANLVMIGLCLHMAKNQAYELTSSLRDFQIFYFAAENAKTIAFVLYAFSFHLIVSTIQLVLRTRDLASIGHEMRIISDHQQHLLNKMNNITALKDQIEKMMVEGNHEMPIVAYDQSIMDRIRNTERKYKDLDNSVICSIVKFTGLAVSAAIALAVAMIAVKSASYYTTYEIFDFSDDEVIRVIYYLLCAIAYAFMAFNYFKDIWFEKCRTLGMVVLGLSPVAVCVAGVIACWLLIATVYVVGAVLASAVAFAILSSFGG